MNTFTLTLPLEKRQNVDLVLFMHDETTLYFDVTSSGSLVDLSTYTRLWFTLKDQPTDAYAAAKIAKTQADMTLNYPTYGAKLVLGTVGLSTANLSPDRDYYVDFQVQESTDGEVMTLAVGRVRFKGQVSDTYYLVS